MRTLGADRKVVAHLCEASERVSKEQRSCRASLPVREILLTTYWS